MYVAILESQMRGRGTGRGFQNYNSINLREL